MNHLLLYSLVYIIPCFFWHVMLHESAHGLVALLYGIKIKLYPYPHIADGHFYFGRVTFDQPLPTSRAVAWLSIAPVLAELLWLATIWCVALLVAPGILVYVVFAELVAPVGDLGNWALGFWTGHDWTDAMKFCNTTSFKQSIGRVSSFLTLLPGVAAILWLVMKLRG